MIKKKKHLGKKYSVKLELANVKWESVEKIFTNDRILANKKSNNHRKISPRTKDILFLLAGGVVIALTFVFPALPMALAPFMMDSKRYGEKRFNQTIGRLKKQKLVEITNEHGYDVVKITDEGKIRALRYKLGEIHIKKPKKWDKRWRLVIFDIPEKEKRMRDIFRRHLKLMGFYQLQKSVWAHPFPCFNEIEFLRQMYNVGINATYVVADKIESVENLKEYFDLS